MAASRPCVGGPLDGLERKAWPAAGWVWLDDGGRATSWAQHLYRRDGEVWIYAGHEYTRCSGCGCMHVRRVFAETGCELCGARLAP